MSIDLYTWTTPNGRKVSIALEEMGLANGGRLNNCLVIGEQGIINPPLRFEDELVRHKILDLLGDLYLLGQPIRGKVTAHRTGHGDNVALLRAIRAEQAPRALEPASKTASALQ